MNRFLFRKSTFGTFSVKLKAQDWSVGGIEPKTLRMANGTPDSVPLSPLEVRLDTDQLRLSVYQGHHRVLHWGLLLTSLKREYVKLYTNCSDYNTHCDLNL